MKRRSLPNSWNLFNLRSSPYWQDPLGDGDQTHPLSLFVGRSSELLDLLNGLYGAGDSSSRRAVAGSAGVGKTTLVKQFKAIAVQKDYLTLDSYVPVTSDETNEGLFGRVLSAVYDTILANRPMTIDHPAMQAAQVLVRASREKTTGGGLSIFGVGASVSQSTSATVPRDMLLDGPRVLRDLMTLVFNSDARGVLLHINNLENLNEADVQRAAVVLRDLRDPMLMHNGLHVVLVGTREAIHSAVLSFPQVRTTFGVTYVDPAPRADVHALLQARYEYLALDRTRPALSPVEPAAVNALYELFNGDLRGLLKALEDGVRPNIGLDGTGSTGPVALEAILPTLQRRYADDLATLDEEARVKQLVKWGTTGPTTTHTQKSLGALWNARQSTVSEALNFLIHAGYVASIPRRGMTPSQYVLTGLSRLIFPALATNW